MKAIRISEDVWNYLKDDGSYLLDKHVKWCGLFYEGFAAILYDDYIKNFINEEGKLLLKTNVYDTWDFDGGIAYVKINNIWYNIDKECNFYTHEDNVSFKELYQEYPNKRSELIEIIQEYTYHDTNDYFNI